MLVACWCLDDDERRRALLDELDAIRHAYLTAYAMWDGKRLEQEREQLYGRLQVPDHDRPDADALIAEAHAYIAGAPRPVSPE